jgi:hypothetical protein
VRVDTHDHLVLPTEALTGKHDSWVEVPRLLAPFVPVVKWIKLLVGRGLTSMMVLFNFLSRCIASLQMRVHPMWQYTGEGDATRLERGHGSGLSLDVMSALLGKLTPDPSSANFITPCQAVLRCALTSRCGRSCCGSYQRWMTLASPCSRRVMSPGVCRSLGRILLVAKAAATPPQPPTRAKERQCGSLLATMRCRLMMMLCYRGS